MQIQYGSTTIAGAGAAGPAQVSYPMGQSVDEQQIFRASLAAAFARGNAQGVIQFQVLWAFDTRSACEAFLITHFLSLSQQNYLVATVGDGESGSHTYQCPNAILLEATPVNQRGLSVVVRYRFRVGQFYLMT